MVTISRPGISGDTPEQQLSEVKKYLNDLARQLQWAFETLETPAAVSVPESIRHRISPQEQFAGIKSLIIKSADIVEAYQQVISKKLSGEYVAKSEFGSYREKTSQEIRAAGDGVTQLLRITRDLNDRVEGLSHSQTDAYLKSGLLGEDREGRPIYGLEIGQTEKQEGATTFRKFARFSTDRLSFFDSSDIEVAYVSDYRLCITQAEVQGNLQLGSHFRILPQGGLIFQWTGGESK